MGSSNGNGQTIVIRQTRTVITVPGLRYLTDNVPGIVRKRTRGRFVYISPKGRAVRDERLITRIKKLAIPPAWEDVWIAPFDNAHLQATGRDARGRKQYRYHERWRQVRDATKFDRLVRFGGKLPALRRKLRADLARPGMPREKILAAMARILETTFIRAGNEEYARTNRSYGLASLRNHHAKVRGQQIYFEFVGKGGKRHSITVKDRRLARIIRKCRELPGQLLFEYVAEDGSLQAVASSDLNQYIKEATGEDFTAKDFRTWAATVLAAEALGELGPAGSKAEAKRKITAALEHVSNRLGNTVSICRKCYVHPAVLECYIDGTLPLETFRQKGTLPERVRVSLNELEKAVLRFLRSCSMTKKRRRPGTASSAPNA